MRSNEDIKHDVDALLQGDPKLDSTDIASKVSEGAVTLCGFVQTRQEKHAAESAVKCIAGVHAVVNDLAIRPNRDGKGTDPEIARGALKALRQELPSVWEKVRLRVCNAHVVLEGAVPRQDLRARAERAVRRVPGVLGIRNSILVQPAIPDGDLADAIEAAIERNALVNSEHILVEVSHSEVTLTGTVNSRAERDEVNQAAWAAPGVTDVIDGLTMRR